MWNREVVIGLGLQIQLVVMISQLYLCGGDGSLIGMGWGEIER